MPVETWVKQLTRENTLLDRSLRTIAYARSVQELGKARMLKCPVVGKGRVTSWYYELSHYQEQQALILRELRAPGGEELLNGILAFLERGYTWAKTRQDLPTKKAELPFLLDQYNYHHAHARGGIVYSYWGEPPITTKVREIVQERTAAEDIDAAVSLLSIPVDPQSSLRSLFHPNPKLEHDKQALLQKLQLTKEEKEWVDLLSRCTIVYELSERVAALLYEKFLAGLQAMVSSAEMGDLEWYDPESLVAYCSGKTLSPEEVALRKEFYVLRLEEGKLRVMTGEEARDYAKHTLKEGSQPVRDKQPFSGTIACKGKVTGAARIVITQADQEKVNPGDILVSPMTTPYLMSAMRRAGAIVTDEGGMTAHAAIVSREFNIPCIVGTKIATHILEDGDLVEVDANRGWVTPLS